MRARDERGAWTLGDGGEVRVVAKEIAAVASATAPWLGQPAVYATLLAEAESLGAGACVILNPDLADSRPQWWMRWCGPFARASATWPCRSIAPDPSMGC